MGQHSSPNQACQRPQRYRGLVCYRDVGMIRLIDTDNQRIDLLVIPVDTTPAIAELALTMATDGQAPDITATVGHHFAPVHRGAEAEESPDTDKGAPQHRAH